jgi:hypothetical protein
MYAAISRYCVAAGSVGTMIRDGRRLAVAIGRLPGFGPYLLD